MIDDNCFNKQMRSPRVWFYCAIAAIITAVFCFYYNRRPVFTFFGPMPFYQFAYTQNPYVDDYGNYLHFDEEKNILLLIVTDNIGARNGNMIEHAYPSFKSSHRCIIFVGTKYEVEIAVKEDSLSMVNALNGKTAVIPIGKNFVQNSIDKLYNIAYYTDPSKTNIMTELRNMLPNHDAEFDQVKVN